MNYRFGFYFFCIVFVIFFGLATVRVTAQNINPDLNFSSGSYIPGYTNSKWPSWGKLGSVIGGAPIDPVNRWAGCEGYDDATCWSVASTTFKCPVFAQMYEYSYVTSTQSYQYHVPFEFIRPTDGAFVSQYARLNNLSFNRFCVPETVITPIGGRCGDGTVNVGEECDPPGRNRVVSIGPDGQVCPVGSYATVTCNASCQYSYVNACVGAPQMCGNGIVEDGEECDAGTRNGQYGSRCTTQCTSDSPRIGRNPPTGQFCGNGELDRNSNGSPLEFCEEVEGACLHLNDNGQIIKSRVHILLDRSSSMSAGNRWASAKTGLTTIFSDLLSQVDFSLSVFSSSTDVCYQGLGTVTDANSRFILDSVSPNGKTPSRCALQTVLDQRNAIFGTNDAVPKKLVFITDGTPTDANDEQVAEVIRLLNENSITTYVIGFSGVPTSTLNLFASAGGTSNPLSTTGDLFFRADRAHEFVTAFDGILGCFEYSQYKQNSCSWNCQDYGAYCGDRIVQVQYGEECDLGSQNGGGSGCTAYCKLPVNTATNMVCGNRIIEGGEECDDGNVSNGDGCSSQCRRESVGALCGNGPQSNDPASGLSRLDPGEECDLGSQNGSACVPGYNTSCTYCSNTCKTVTVEAVAYCGNGRIDSMNSSLTERCDYVGTAVYGPTSTEPIRCSDKGTVACLNSCQNLSMQCATCGLGLALPTPRISILNPMTQEGKSPFTPTVGYVDLYRKKNTNSSFTLDWLGYRKINYRTASDNTYIDPFEPYTLLINSNFQPITDRGLETNSLCDGEYALLFNKNHISQAVSGSISNTTPVQVVERGLGDLFEYSVRGEAGMVTNEVVMSPAVPENQIRVVVRWKQNGTVLFTGNVYQDNGRPYNTINYISTSTSGGNTWCGEAVKDSQGYYVPSNCVQVGNVWIHKILNPTSTTQGLQAFTFRTSQVMSLNTIGFYVSSPNGPLNQLKDYELWVDVYEYRLGQVPEHSIYKPTHSFVFKNAIPSANPLARYWHAFNLNVRTASSGAALGIGYEVVPIVGAPHGKIVTSECEVRAGMPNTTPCTLSGQ